MNNVSVIRPYRKRGQYTPKFKTQLVAECQRLRPASSELAAQALGHIGQLYQVERETKDLPPDKRHSIRNEKAQPIADALHQWMLVHRQSPGLQPQTLDSAEALSGGLCSAHRQ